MNASWALLEPTRTKGFTIVELLIVIVVIGILAAITIVAYNGFTTSSKTASAKSSASIAAKKAGTYHAETGNYPTASTDLTGAASTNSYHLTGVTFGTPAANASPSTLIFRKCGSGTPTTQSAITTPSGIQMLYFDYGAGNSTSFMSAGVVSGSGIACPSAP